MTLVNWDDIRQVSAVRTVSIQSPIILDLTLDLALDCRDNVLLPVLEELYPLHLALRAGAVLWIFRV